MIPSQMLKGTLEGCILGILSQQETYGYEISSQLTAYGFGAVPEGTIYPLLLRLEKNGLVSAAFRPSVLDKGAVARAVARLEERGLVERVVPDRCRREKLVSLTPAGEAELQQFIQNYNELSQAVGNLLSALKGDADHE